MTEPLTCAACRALLIAYSAGHLSPEHAALVEAHLATCADCAAEYQQWAQVATVMDRAAQAIPPDAHAERGWATLAAAIAPESSMRMKGTVTMSPPPSSEVPPAAPTPAGRPPRRWQTLASVAVVILLIGASLALFTALRHRVGTTGIASSAPSCTPQPQHGFLPLGAYISKVDMLSSDDGWAVSSMRDPEKVQPTYSIFWHYTNCTWQRAGQTVPGVTLYQVAMSSPDEGWATGTTQDPDMTIPNSSHLVLYHYTNHQWSPATLPATDVYDTGNVTASPAGDSWLVGEMSPFGNSNFRQPSQLLHYINGAWQRLTLPAQFATVTINDLVSDAADDVWLVADDYRAGVIASFIAHYQGGRWTFWPQSDQDLLGLNDIAVITPNDAWVLGQGRTATVSGNSAASTYPSLFHYDGHIWQRVRLPEFENLPIYAQPQNKYTTTHWLDFAFTGSNDGWVVGSDLVPTPHVRGEEPSLYHYDGTTWQEDDANLPKDLLALDSITMVSPQEGWATATLVQTGQIAQDNALLHYSNGVWNLYS